MKGDKMIFLWYFLSIILIIVFFMGILIGAENNKRERMEEWEIKNDTLLIEGKVTRKDVEDGILRDHYYFLLDHHVKHHVMDYVSWNGSVLMYAKSYYYNISLYSHIKIYETGRIEVISNE
jgi:hypothetical protein